MCSRTIKPSMVILVSGLLVAGSVFAQKPYSLPEIDWLDIVETNAAVIKSNDVSLFVSAEKARYWVHEPITLSVSLANTGREDVAALHCPGCPIFTPYELYVLFPKSGRRSQETEYWKEQLQSFVGPGGSLAIRAGEEVKQSLDINRLFDMTPSGDYRIFVRKEVTLFNPQRKVMFQTPAITIHVDDRPMTNGNQPKK